jgi:aminotransferase
MSALAGATGAVNLAQGSPDFSSPAPLQEAATKALKLPDSYYWQLSHTYDKKRRFMSRSLSDLGFTFVEPEGA